MRSEALFRVSSRNAALEQLMNGRIEAVAIGQDRAVADPEDPLIAAVVPYN